MGQALVCLSNVLQFQVAVLKDYRHVDTLKLNL